MEYVLSYDYVALLLLIVITISYLLKFRNTTMTQQGKYFIAMCVTHFMTNLFDVFMTLEAVENSQGAQLVSTICAVGYFITHNSLPFLYLSYIMSITKGITKKVTNRRFLLPLIFSSCLILLSPIYHFIFYVDENGVYYRGPYLFLLYIISFLYIAIGFVYLNRSRNILVRTTRFALQYGFFGISIVTMIIQIFNPSLLIEGFGISMCFLIIYFTIESPESIIDSSTGAFNSDAFLYDTALALKNKQSFYVLSITTHSQENLLKSLGVKFLAEFRKQIANYLKQLTPMPMLYSVSNRSFCLILAKSEVMDMEQYIEQIRKRFEQSFFVKVIEVYADATFCLFRCPEDTEDNDNIMKFLTYLENGQGNFRDQVLYACDLDLNIEEWHQKIRQAVQRAIRERGFEVYYQPIYNTQKEKVTSAEALIRLRDPDVGFISPEEFIPLAEENGTIFAIGDFVLEEVCRFMKENNLQKLGIEYIEVNMSVLQCMSPNMTQNVLNIIHRYGISPSMLNLEITETAAMDSPKVLGNNMVNLVQENISFSLDDYGSGFSTINYMIHLPFRLIKLDKSIVWSSFQNEKAKIALESTVVMIQKLQMEIVAEGVETEEQRKTLTDIGVQYLQGYYFSRPLPEGEFLDYLNSTGTRTIHSTQVRDA